MVDHAKKVLAEGTRGVEQWRHSHSLASCTHALRRIRTECRLSLWNNDLLGRRQQRFLVYWGIGGRRRPCPRGVEREYAPGHDDPAARKVGRSDRRQPVFAGLAVAGRLLSGMLQKCVRETCGYMHQTRRKRIAQRRRALKTDRLVPTCASSQHKDPSVALVAPATSTGTSAKAGAATRNTDMPDTNKAKTEIMRRRVGSRTRK